MSDETSGNGTPLRNGNPHALCMARKPHQPPEEACVNPLPCPVHCSARCNDDEYGERHCPSIRKMTNGRCRMHGGSTPRGPALPQFKHGDYSSVVPKDMRAAYKRVRNNPNLLNLEKDVAALETKQRAVLLKMDEENPPPWGDAVETANDCAVELRRKKPDLGKLRAAFDKHFQVVRTGIGADANLRRLWAEFRELALEKEKLVTAERNWAVKLRSMYTAEQGLALQYAIVEAAKRRFGDQPDRLADFLDDALRLLDDPDKPKQVEAE